MLEWFGVLSGLLYLSLEIRQKSAMWIVGFISSMVYVFVFFSAKLYANASLNVYFVAMSVYGFWQWRKASATSEMHEIEYRRLSLKQWVVLTVISAFVFGFIKLILEKYTDSTFSFGDAFVTALSIVATWMVARKYIEHWLVWIVVNLFSIYLYIHQQLYPTAGLYFFYSVLSVYGFFQWRKSTRIE